MDFSTSASLHTDHDLAMTRAHQMDSQSRPDEGKLCCRIQKLPPLRAIVTLVACFTIEFTLAVSYTTGNMLPYVTSYLRNATGDTSVSYTNVVWADNCSWIVTYAGIAFLGLLEQRLPHRAFLFIGVVSFAVSYAGSYWTVQTSVVAFVAVFGIFQGVAQAILWPSAVNVALRWFPEKKHLVGGFVMTGYGAGTFAWNQVVTMWINPHNLQPDITVGESLYFSQPELLDNVPSCYLLIGLLLSGIQLLCLLVVAYPSTLSTTVTVDANTDLPSTQNGDESKTHLTEVSEATHTEKSKSDSIQTCENGSSAAEHALLRMTGEEEQLTENDQWSDPAFILRDVLISRVTWSMWCVNLTGGLGFVYIWNYWKAYGQTFIRDDHFLALVGSCAGIVGAVARPLMGWMAQRIGSLSCYWLAFSLLTVTSATFVVCEYAGKPMYFAWVCLMYMAIGIYYTIYTPLYYALFGARYFSFALGVVSTSGVLYLLVSLFLAAASMEILGWHGVFFLSAACEFLALVFSVSLRFDCGGTIPAHMKRELFARKRKDMERTE